MADAISEFGRNARGAVGRPPSPRDDFRQILNDAPIGAFQYSDSRIIAANPSLAEMLGWESVDMMMADDAYCSNLLSAFDVVFECGVDVRLEQRVELHRKDGSLLVADLIVRTSRSDGRTTRILEGFVEDLTELESLREELRQAQELAMRGQLAGGIAHDFNNILSATLIHLGLLMQDPDLPASAKEALREMEEETKRAADLTRQLLSFSRRSAVTSLEPVELNALVGELLPLLRRLARENILVVFLPSKEECWIKADAGLIEMLVMHLCLLSRRAMPQGGTLTLATYLSDADDAVPLQVCLAAAQARPNTQKAMRKSGTLITSWPDEQREPSWQAIREIVTLHNGQFKAPTVAETSAPYRIFLPGVVPTVTCAPGRESDELSGGGETVLLIEDERYLRRMSTLCLRKLGYAVFEAGDAEEAARLWEKHRQEIDVVFTDFLLPGFSTGLELSRRMEKEKPSLKILVTSGQGGRLEEAIEAGGAGLAHLSKPYSTSELAKALRRCLDQPKVAQN